MIPRCFNSDFAQGLSLPKGATVNFTENGWYANIEGQSFRLTDRGLDPKEFDPGINHWTNGAISKSIERIIGKKGHARVLDLGCGTLHQAAFDIAKKYEDHVTVHAIDVIKHQEAPTRDNLIRHLQDARKIPLENQKIDFAYSFQLIPYFNENEKTQILSELLRTLSYDGEAVIDMLDGIGFDNRWIENTFTNGHYGSFRPFERRWAHEDTTGAYSFNPIIDFNQCQPGFISLSGRRPTPFVHITKKKDYFDLF